MYISYIFLFLFFFFFSKERGSRTAWDGTLYSCFPPFASLHFCRNIYVSIIENHALSAS